VCSSYGNTDSAVEFAVLRCDERTQTPRPHILNPQEIDRVLEKHQLAKPTPASDMAVDA
jgi:hypothetical protein